MKLEDIVAGQRVTGIVAQSVEILTSRWVGADYLQVTFQTSAGDTHEAMLDRVMEQQLEVERASGPGTSHEDVRDWKLAVEALRIRHAGLIDPMLAVSSSSLRPLPHQIKAVYGELLPRTPLRYLLADDPGAGKTIMCGLYVKELILRGDLDRCLIVAPGGLVDQWVEELWEKVGLQFRVLTRELISTTVGGSVFDDNPRLIARMDMLARNEELQELLARSEWDLVVVDEAHRMSARRAGQEMDTTKRYDLGRLLGDVTRNLLLMTATPHSGDPAAFQAFLALLDEDRFVGRRSEGQIPTTDVMRRMLKEELLTMDGKPLFPERRASTVRYSLSGPEQDLYEAVSEYVRHEMNRADALRRQGDRRGHTIGFALTVLQRRLASSPEAILRSLERRRERLTRLRAELLASGTDAPIQDPELAKVTVPRAPDSEEAEQEQAAMEHVEDVVADAASAAQSAAELAVEIEVLDGLVQVAADVRMSAQDSKWLQLRSILEEDVLTRDEDGTHRKIIIFSEHRDTLRYLTDRIRALPGRSESVVEIHGGMSRTQRLDVRRRFTHEESVSVLVATDAAGEGLNLQCAHLMVNYDLPWNPNRIEQRFGRIHRIGQTEVCHLWNLVADGTREGDVFSRLLDKMHEQSKAFRGKVFDVLGEAFEGAPLRDLLVKAVRYGDDPEIRRQLDTVIDDRVGRGIPELVERRALYAEVLQRVDLDQARAQVDVGARSRIQPHFTSSWFESALQQLGGRSRRRADGTVEVGYLPDDVRSLGRSRGGAPLKSRYDSVNFDPDAGGADGTQPVELLVPGHPLLDSMAEATEQKLERSLRDGVLLVDESGHHTEPRAFIAVLHEVVDGHSKPRTLSRRVAFVEVDQSGGSRDAGPSYLDYRPVAPGEIAALDSALAGAFRGDALSDLGVTWALQEVVPDHVASVRGTHAVAVERAKVDVVERLGQELQHWRGHSVRGGRDGESVYKAQRRAEEIEGRLAKRLADLEADGQVVARPPRVLATALVVPAGMLGSASDDLSGALAAAAQHIADVRTGQGYDVHREAGPATLRCVDANGTSSWVDVVAQPASGRAVTFSRTQVMHARNLGERHQLALVKLGTGADHDVRFVSDPFRRVRLGTLEQHSVDMPWITLWRHGEVL